MLHLKAVLLALAAGQLGIAIPSGTSETTAGATTKYCDVSTTICYAEYTSPANVIYRIALPDTATTASPFDILLQIIAPRTVGWAAVAWGGQMAYNPLTVAWPNGNSTIVSSRRATGHILPGTYPGATYATLPGSKTNATHWQLDVLCSGCSQWTDQNGKAVALNPAGTSVPLAYGSSVRAVTDPSNNASRFSAHDSKGRWLQDLNSAKIANFTSLVHAYANAVEVSAT